MVSRRALLQLAAVAGARADDATLPPVRAITRGPKHHWFGYYDKLQFDPACRLVLGMEVDFEHRSPGPFDSVRIGFVDLQAGDKWIDLGIKTRAWNWQQGCMLQWLPRSKSSIIWNDREDGRFVSHILDVRTQKRRTIPAPIYAVSPDARWALSPDFRRLHDLRPGYGYAGIPDPNREVPRPDDAGIWKTDLRSGGTELILSIAQVAALPGGKSDPDTKHWFNHLLWSPDGRRFVFLHRWQRPRGFGTRMITASADGRELYVLDPHGETSHFIWRDSTHILAWAFHPSHGNRFCLYRDQTDQVEVVGRDAMTVNGHCTYLPGNRWILNDTYPDKQRLQHPYLYEVATGRRVPLGHFHSPPQYTGEWRCDLHPRFSPDGRKVVIDSPHGGEGRQMWLIDISEIPGVTRG
jgi:hypothetical protein